MMRVKGWGERELPEGLKWLPITPWSGHYLVSTEHDHENDRRYRASQTTAEQVLRVFAPDQIEEEPKPCRERYLGWGCGLVDQHPQYPHMSRTMYGCAGIAWVRGDINTVNSLTLPRDMVAIAPWFDGGAHDEGDGEDHKLEDHSSPWAYLVLRSMEDK